MTAVLDSWAVLRYLEDTAPAADAAAELVDAERPLMSWINLGEVRYVVQRAHGEDAAAETVRDLRRVVDPRLPTESLVQDAARITADHTMAFADAFAAALAVAEGAELWTGDPELLLDGSPWRWRDLRSTG
ncbi:MAG: PIN domain-containing protein [Actinomycetota bacterium]